MTQSKPPRPPRRGREPERPSPVARIVHERWTDEPPSVAAHDRRPSPHRAANDVRGAGGDDAIVNSDAGVEHVRGVKPVLETLRAKSRPIERVLVAETATDSRLREVLELARASGTPVRRVGRAEIERVTGAQVNHQGVVALVAAARYHDAEELLARLTSAEAARPPLVVVLDGVEDPRNLGAIIRTAECAGAGGVFLPERRAAGLTDTVAKTAAGALEHLPIARAGNTVDLIERMKRLGIWTVGAVADAKADYTTWDWRTPSALVLGGEGAGLRKLVRERCDALVSIPLLGNIESLNVSVAAGIVLYEAVRQRVKDEGGRMKDEGKE